MAQLTIDDYANNSTYNDTVTSLSFFGTQRFNKVLSMLKEGNDEIIDQDSFYLFCESVILKHCNDPQLTSQLGLSVDYQGVRIYCKAQPERMYGFKF